MPLPQNAKKSFQGSIVLGKGFVLTIEEAERLIAKDPRNKDVLFPYLNGDDLNNDPEQKPSRWVINFFDWTEEKARTYPDCFEILERRVKPERQRWALDKDGNEIVGTFALRKPLPQQWWIYGEKRPALYETISKLDQVMVIPRVTKYSSMSFVPVRQVFHDKVIVLTYANYNEFAILQSSIHDEWARKYSSTLGGLNNLNYSPSECLETFPFPIALNKELMLELEKTGREYYETRTLIMRNLGIGLTKLYNSFHNIEDKDLNQLRKIQMKMDNLVIQSYGWNDLRLSHDFYSIEYLPENDNVRFGIEAKIKKEILKRLHILNADFFNQNIGDNNISSVRKRSIKIGNSQGSSFNLFS
jgi:hypothetical protein